MRPITAQRGLALPVVLIALLAILVAAVSLLRSGNVSSTTAGNVAFKESATQAADLGLVAARKALNDIDTPDVTSTASGYYATTGTFTVDQNGLPGVNWTDTTTFPQVSVGNGAFQYQYVIERLCSTTPVTNAYSQCSARPMPISTSANPGSYQAGSQPLMLPQVSYRVTVHVTGPRSGENFVQAILNR